jgi:hypothetical protein
MAPNRYTELFFLDEVTGLAAGHRPCFECRRQSFNAYADAWAIASSSALGKRRPTADSIDERLHAERVSPDRSKRTFQANVDDLPDGVLITLEGWDEHAHLIQGEELLAWSPGGYRDSQPRPRGERVSVLTPESTVKVIRAGYVPEVHPSASCLLAEDRLRPRR